MDHLEGKKERTRIDDSAHPQLVYLKRKLEDLEEVHKDGKRAHLMEAEGLKSEIDRSRRVNKGQAEQITRLKKQHEASDLRLHDLQKQLSAAQTESRELRNKLRCAEEERTKLSGKRSETVELRRALTSAEAKRRDELSEKDKRITELDHTLLKAVEESGKIESRLEKCKASLNKELREAHREKDAVQSELEQTRRQLARSEEDGIIAQKKSDSSLEELKAYVKQLEQLLEHTAKECGTHSSSSASLIALEEQQLRCCELQLQAVRLQRKLANAEEQVHELTQLVRQSQESNTFLSERIRAAEEEIQWRSKESVFNGSVEPLQSSETDLLLSEIQASQNREHSGRIEELMELQNIAEKQFEFSRLQNRQLLEQLAAPDSAASAARAELLRANEKLANAEKAVSKLSYDNSDQKKELGGLASENSRHVKEIYALQTQIKEINEALTMAEEQTKLQSSRHDEQLRKEKELSSRFQSAAQQSKMAEDALRDEIQQLSNDLLDAEAYREAYENLAAEMRNIVARNEVAEEEAGKLSQFNAEILSHYNPTQRIFYVDRIRRELAESKQQLALSTQNHESAMAENAQLQEELAMYKSIAIPFEGKPRTNMTRVRRVPFAARSLNKQQAIQEETFDGKASLARYLPSSIEPDMTLDELS